MMMMMMMMIMMMMMMATMRKKTLDNIPLHNKIHMILLAVSPVLKERLSFLLSLGIFGGQRRKFHFRLSYKIHIFASYT